MATAAPRVGFAGSLARLGHALRVTFLLEDGGHATRRLRAQTLAGLVALAFAVLGSLRLAAQVASPLGEKPFEFDYSFRVVSAGWFSTSRTFPVALVDIDERTHRAWGSPIITPRRELARLLQTVTIAQPAAVFVDIDLSGDDAAARLAQDDADDRALADYLTRYRGAAPIVFPRRLDPGAGTDARLASTPFDSVFAGNPRLRWAHAAFVTDTDGKVRAWREWLAYCADGRRGWLPSVSMALADVLHLQSAGTTPAAAPPVAAGACDGTGDSSVGPARRLLLGPRLTGDGRHHPLPDATSISASLLLDPELARDDARLFGGRAVFIGASHARSGDFWLTPSGIYPGVELLANIVRFATVQAETSGWAAQLGHRCIALALFLVFAWLGWQRRGQVAVVLATVLAVAYLAVAVGAFDDFAAFDVLEAAILMFIVYKAAESVLDFCGVLQSEWRRAAKGPRWYSRLVRTLAAASRQPHPPGLAPGDTHGPAPH
jgi:CHASE2 domain-containing sensor protein